jgi:hypothetical protein
MPNNGAGTMGTVYINNVVKQMKTDLRLIQEQQPLVHNITNYVAMNFVANSLLAIGASPIMARAEEEVEEISSKSNALALNLGVPESTTAHSMILAGEAAMKKRIPIVFDVVGVGATRFRMDIASPITPPTTRGTMFLQSGQDMASICCPMKPRPSYTSVSYPQSWHLNIFFCDINNLLSYHFNTQLALDTLPIYTIIDMIETAE